MSQSMQHIGIGVAYQCDMATDMWEPFEGQQVGGITVLSTIYVSKRNGRHYPVRCNGGSPKCRGEFLKVVRDIWLVATGQSEIPLMCYPCSLNHRRPGGRVVTGEYARATGADRETIRGRMPEPTEGLTKAERQIKEEFEASRGVSLNKTGLPDFWYRDGDTISFVEAKAENDRLSQRQQAAHNALVAAGLRVETWWLMRDGSIRREEIVRASAQKAA